MRIIKIGLLAIALLCSTVSHAGNLTGVFIESSSIDYHSLDVVLKNKLDKELKCLADNIYYEAGAEPFEGRVAVAQVTLNRVESGKFPNTICGVISQKTKIMTIDENAKPINKIICQFSWFCTTKRVGPTSKNNTWEDSMEVAKMVLLDGYRIPILENALYFHATHVRPGWKLPKVIKVGNHIFYAERKKTTDL